MKGTRQVSCLVYVGLLGVGLLCGVLTGIQTGARRGSLLTAAGREDCQTPGAPQVRAALATPDRVANMLYRCIQCSRDCFTGWNVCAGHQGDRQEGATG